MSSRMNMCVSKWAVRYLALACFLISSTACASVQQDELPADPPDQAPPAEQDNGPGNGPDTGPEIGPETGPDEGPAQQPVEAGPRKPMKLPGLVIDFEHQRVDVQAKVCLRRGALELIACTQDTKEHESIFVLEAAPVHIHTGLLMLGAKNGNPAITKPANEEHTKWVHLPPRGDKVVVTVVFKDEQGKEVERPVSDFVERNLDAEFEPLEEDPVAKADEPEQVPPAKVFEVFLFAGSQVYQDDQGRKQYLADQSGNAISISTFGDELLCLPERHSQQNGSLAWKIEPKHLPKLGSKVTLRLTLVKKDAADKEQGEQKPQEPQAAEEGGAR